jgi:hypothetical protein
LSSARRRASRSTTSLTRTTAARPSTASSRRWWRRRTSSFRCAGAAGVAWGLGARPAPPAALCGGHGLQGAGGRAAGRPRTAAAALALHRLLAPSLYPQTTHRPTPCPPPPRCWTRATPWRAAASTWSATSAASTPASASSCCSTRWTWCRARSASSGSHTSGRWRAGGCCEPPAARQARWRPRCWAALAQRARLHWWTAQPGAAPAATGSRQHYHGAAAAAAPTRALHLPAPPRREELPTVAFKCSTQQQATNMAQRKMGPARSSSDALHGAACLGADTLLQVGAGCSPPSAADAAAAAAAAPAAAPTQMHRCVGVALPSPRPGCCSGLACPSHPAVWTNPAAPENNS